MNRRLIPVLGRVVQTLWIVLILAAAVPSGWTQDFSIPRSLPAGPQAAQEADSNTALLYSGTLYPPGMEWKSITTPHNQLIFPAGEEDAALQAASVMMGAWPAVQEDFDISLESYPLVVNTSLDITNGYFGLAPRKSEWYSYPSQTQFGGPADWYALLAFHEGRHAAQFSALDQGFIRWGRFLAGEYGWAGLSFYSIPLWYFEGDAILSETAFSGAGRGNTASFHREVRAIAVEGAGASGAEGDGKLAALPSYRQAYLGSYRKHFPSYYHLGYPLVTYIRMMYGGDAWNEILKETARFAFWPLRFHRAVKKITGRTVDQLYEDSMSFLAAYWSMQEAGDDSGRFTYLSPEPKIWTNYYPVAAGREGVIYIRVSGDDRASELVRLSPEGGLDPGAGEGAADDTLQEERLFSFNARDGWIDVNGDRAVWAEQIPHPLWAKVSTSDLVVRDLDGNGRLRLTQGMHLQAPVFSPEGKFIAAVEVRPGGASSLVFFDASDGSRHGQAVPELDYLLPEPEEEALHLLHPAWSEDGSKLAVVGSYGGKSVLLEYDPAADRWDVLYGPSEETVGYPRYWKNLLFYTSDYSGREAVYVLDPVSGERRLGAEGKFAAVMPLPIDNNGGPAEAASLIFADYSLKGFRLAAVPLDTDDFRPVPEAAGGRINYAEEAAAQLITGLRASSENGAKRVETKKTETAPAEPYRPAAHLLNFHSWGLLPTGGGRVELFARSDDPVGLLSLRTFAGFNPAGESYDAGFQGVYRGTFPVIQFGLSGDINHPGDSDRQYLGFTGVFGLEAPVNLSRGIWRRSVSLGTDLFIRTEEAAPAEANGGMDMVLPIRHSLTLYNGSTAVSPKDFAPPWEQYVNWNWYYVPVQEEYAGWRLEQRGELVFPGLFRHHRLGVRLDAEWNGGEEIPLNMLPIRPRGYTFDWNEEYPGDLVAGLEYTLPLVSPDLAIGNIYFLKRILLTLFSDVGMAGLKAEDFLRADTLEYYPSSGIELIGEQHLFNWPVSLLAGVRLVYRWRDDTFRVEDSLFTLGFEWN